MPVRTILFVSPNPGDALLFASALRRRDAGLRLRHLANSRRAFDYLSGRGEFAEGRTDSGPDLVVLDRSTCGPRGLALLRWLRRGPALKALPVIVLTAAGQTEGEREAMKLGATTYVSKDYDWAPLLDNVQYIFSKKRDILEEK